MPDMEPTPGLPYPSLTGLGSVLVGGERRAAVLAGPRIGLTGLTGGLDAAIRAGIDPRDAVVRWVDADTVTLDAPLRPEVVHCLGHTYASHVREKEAAGHTADEKPEEPEYFLRAGQTISTPGEPFRLDPAHIAKLDYETELGIVIGRRTSRVPAGEALAHVHGYLVVNDLTARERQIRTAADGTQRMAADAAKNFDGATLLGPAVTPAAAVPDPGALEVSTLVNGELKQSDTTAALLFSVAELVSYLSHFLTLLPGAVVATGTPGGTGWSTDGALGGTGLTPPGCTPARYLRAGDRLISRITGVGEARLEVTAA
ncbi:fumarylacetoacetate hydrolase family protein [Streptomyces sp. NPDC091292]|uniref:fumarylacetoacetate hydrolase family protein n=1 Tax=Streptomyces sp. NPDC091292 TaxID=3365991 RepID=UPI003825C31D